ncbi:MAG: hypothetical protein J5884_00505 [Paludibacteraceae bacterium]|nr:hypothetical protein [Paludibacteraceae bacterium]
MRQWINIVFFLLCCAGVVVLVPSCGTSSSIPLDDAYFWPDKSYTEQSVNNQSRESDNIEVLDENDNSVTVRVKK